MAKKNTPAQEVRPTQEQETKSKHTATTFEIEAIVESFGFLGARWKVGQRIRISSEADYPEAYFKKV